MNNILKIKEKFRTNVQKIGIELSNQQVNTFFEYLRMLKEWNKVMNLTAIEEDEEIIEKHFIDSLLCADVINIQDNQKLIDVGTGAGFPGVPLKIWNPVVQLSLLEATQKKTDFLRALCEELKLESVEIITGRAEEVGRDSMYRDAFDWVVARAVARLDVLAEYCLPFTKTEGYWIAFKGPGIFDELEEAKYAIDILGGEILGTRQYKLPMSNEMRAMVIVKKNAKTPDKYPRRTGKPKKAPIGKKI